MKASDLKAKLERDLAASNGSIAAMERERITLALPAHSGDESAMLRVVELRSDIDGKRAGLRDLEQALADIEPAVMVEQATERLHRREALYMRYRASCADVMAKMGAIDAAVLQLAEAFRAAADPVERARYLAVDLMVPIGGQIGHQAIQRMMVAQNVAIHTVQELIETSLEDVHVLSRQMAPFPRRPEMKLTEEMRRSLVAVDARVHEAVESDRRASVQAGVVLEPEPA